MNDLVFSAAGRDQSDRAFKAMAAAKPLWHLVPLPFDRINQPTPRKRRGPPPSLQSLCLSTISRNLHRLSAASLLNAAPHILQRVLKRIRSDRGYEDDRGGEKNYNPDEATIWALSALLNPEEAEEDHLLALVTDITLLHLTPNPLFQYPEHPLIQLPKLYAAVHPNPGLDLLTTLTLDSLVDGVTDSSIQSLKYATHLTVLWMKGCRVSDDGIRLLGSSLSLEGDAEERRGMWRLRAWFLPGCKGVGDRSMRVFARYPGLVALDVRNTSVTSFGIDILNRSNPFIGHSPFQPCTQGLSPIFQSGSSQAESTANLAITLLRNPSAPLERRHFALHILPTMARPLNEWLPDPPRSQSPTQPKRQISTASAPTVYRSGGIGQIYGSNVSRVTDEAMDFRMKIQDAKEARMRAEAYEDRSKPEKKAKEHKFQGRTYTVGSLGRLGTHTAGKVFKEKKPPRITKKKLAEMEQERQREEEERAAELADRRSKAFAVGMRKPEKVLSEASSIGSQGEEAWMLVRMVPEDWESATWSNISAGVHDVNIQPMSTSQRAKVGNLVADLLGATNLPAQSSPTPMHASPNYRPSSSQNTGTTPSQPSQPTPSRKPFQQSVTPASGNGPLFGSSPAEHRVNDPLAFAGTSQKRTFEG